MIGTEMQKRPLKVLANFCANIAGPNEVPTHRLFQRGEVITFDVDTAARLLAEKLPLADIGDNNTIGCEHCLTGFALSKNLVQGFVVTNPVRLSFNQQLFVFVPGSVLSPTQDWPLIQYIKSTLGDGALIDSPACVQCPHCGYVTT